MFKPKQKTLKQTLVAAVLKAVVVTVGFGGTFAGMSAITAGQMNMVAPEHQAPSVQKPTAEGSPAFFLKKHDCWTGEAPKDMEGKMPGHVVVTVKTEARYAGSAMVGKALEQIFEGADHGLTVHGFCR